MLTDTEYKALRRQADRFDRYVRKHHSGRGGWISYRTEELPVRVQRDYVANDLRSKMEVYEFTRDKPERYFAYVSDTHKGKVTTWTGDVLGEVTRLGPKFRVGFWPGAERQSIRFRAITGDVYAGWYYCGSGNYCRVRKVKGV